MRADLLRRLVAADKEIDRRIHEMMLLAAPRTQVSDDRVRGYAILVPSGGRWYYVSVNGVLAALNEVPAEDHHGRSTQSVLGEELAKRANALLDRVWRGEIVEDVVVPAPSHQVGSYLVTYELLSARTANIPLAVVALVREGGSRGNQSS